MGAICIAMAQAMDISLALAGGAATVSYTHLTLLKKTGKIHIDGNHFLTASQ